MSPLTGRVKTVLRGVVGVLGVLALVIGGGGFIFLLHYAGGLIDVHWYAVGLISLGVVLLWAAISGDLDLLDGLA